MQNRRFLLFLFTVNLFLFTFLSCHDSDQAIPEPPRSEQFQWGGSMDEIKSSWLEQGWKQEGEENGELNFSRPVLDDNVGDDTESPYRVRLFFNENKLAIARVHYQARPNALSQFKNKLYSQFKLTEPAFKKEKNDTTESGNAIKENMELFQNDEYIIRSYITKVFPEEKELKDTFLDELDLELYKISENPGITLDAMK